MPHSSWICWYQLSTDQCIGNTKTRILKNVMPAHDMDLLKYSKPLVGVPIVYNIASTFPALRYNQFNHSLGACGRLSLP